MYDQILRGSKLSINRDVDVGVDPELAYSFTNNAQQEWTLARIHSVEQSGFGGQLVFETRASAGAPGDTTNEHMRIDSNGNVGIGTATPTQALEVIGIVKATAFEGNGAGLTNVSTTDSTKVAKAGDTMTGPLNLPANGLTVGTNQLVIIGGNVGIGAPSPTTKLEVAGNISLISPDTKIYCLQLARNDEDNRRHMWSLWHMNSSYRKNALEIWEYKTDSTGKDCGGNSADGAMCTPRLVILEGGNVGIGTPTPTQAIEVAGTVKAMAFQGNGAGLTNVSGTDSTKVAKAGDTMTGPLTLPVNGLVVGGTQFAVTNGKVGIGTTSPAPDAKLDVSGFTRSLGVSVNDASNTGVGRGLWLWAATDSNHVIYSASPSGKSPANNAAVRGFFDEGHRLRLRTCAGQAFLFENNAEVALVDIDSDDGRLWTRGAFYAGNSDLYFTKTDHNHTGIGNAAGYAAIENSANFNTLMILGRTVSTSPLKRSVSVWDELNVYGQLVVSGSRIGHLASGNMGDGWSKWSTIGIPDLGFPPNSQNYYGLKVNWDSDSVVFGLKDYGSNRKDAIIAWGDDANDNLRFLRPNDVDAMIITGGGNVGIGTTSPQYPVDVNGYIRANRYCALNSLILSDYQTVNPSSNVYLYSPPNDRDSWLFLDSADTSSNWGIYHRQIDSTVKWLPANSIGFIGGGNSDLKAYICLGDGSAYFKGNIGSHGYFPDSGYSSGWAGGVHTWDVLAHGTGRAEHGWQTGGLDLAEKFENYDKSLEYGDVVAADPENSETLIRTTSPYQHNLLGVISEKPGFLLGVSWEDPKYPIALALAGRVPVKVNLEGGAIRIGDYLTSSNEPGYAMKANESGRVIGIALEPFDGNNGNKGKIILFINLHWIQRDKK